MDTIKPKKKHLTSDLLAGLTFALVNIPQAMAHALLATVNPVLGLYTLMLATPVGALFTSATFMNVALVNSAPTGVASIRVYRPNTGLTAASRACAMAWGIFTRAKVRPASKSEVRCFFFGLIMSMLRIQADLTVPHSAGKFASDPIR